MSRESQRDAEFDARNEAMISAMNEDSKLRAISDEWLNTSFGYEYSYHFEWLGVPIIQYPQDIVAVQEVVWETQPRAIIETGVARGGSIVFYASLLRMLGGDRKVIGVDIDIRDSNRAAIENHPMSDMVTLIEGDSTDDATVSEVKMAIGDLEPVMVVLDSNHTHDHVLRELRAYGDMVSSGCYMVVFDTLIETLDPMNTADRPWDQRNNPASAVREFLESSDQFVVDRRRSQRLLITAADGGYLRRVSVPVQNGSSPSSIEGA